MEWLKHLVIEKRVGCIVVNEQRQGVMYIKYMNSSTLRNEDNYLNGLRHGTTYKWSYDGRILRMENYTNGIKN
jgi:antitoxin component YwqK of YwqJK toxin-antitoxin module